MPKGTAYYLATCMIAEKHFFVPSQGEVVQFFKVILLLSLTACSMIPVPVPVVESYEFQDKMLYNFWDHDNKDSRSELRDHSFVESFGRNCELLKKGRFNWTAPNIVQGGTKSDYFNGKIDEELVNIFKEDGNVVIFDRPQISTNNDFQKLFAI